MKCANETCDASATLVLFVWMPKIKTPLLYPVCDGHLEDATLVAKQSGARRVGVHPVSVGEPVIRKMSREMETQ